MSEVLLMVTLIAKVYALVVWVLERFLGVMCLLVSKRSEVSYVVVYFLFFV